MANTSEPRSTLFPMFDTNSVTPGKGLAASAACADAAGQGHEVSYKRLRVRSILNKTVSKRRLSLAYSINPYRGCEFACRYCYARYTHGFLAPTGAAGSSPSADPELFERLIFLKQGAPWLLEQELRRFEPGQEIAIGTATDPYQPLERTARVTRSLLDVFAKQRAHRIGIVTKSQLILRDLDLLARIAEQNTLVVHLTITTPDTKLARLLEPRAPRPDLRFRAVKRLRENGITAGILCSPLLPGITDLPEQIDTMAFLAREADASFFAAEPLFLKSCSRPTFLSFIREHFPSLASDYEARFGSADFADSAYRRRLERDVARSCARYGLAHRSTDALLTRDSGPARHAEARGPVAQQSLFR